MKKPKIILGIESSCDETACAILKKDGDRVTILSNVVASSADLQAKFGGVIPEQAAREQLKSIIPVIAESLEQARIQHQVLDAIAVTQGPGLIGSLLVGVETAKTLALVWNKPLIPVNHLIGHFYANWITPIHLPGVKAHLEGVVPSFPCIGLLVSGGHTDLVLFTDHGKYKYLGGTRDDAAGECFDKCARLLGLPYPGGPNLSKLAEKGNPKTYKLPRPMLNSGDFDFSFSGLKTAVVNLIKTGDERQNPQKVADLAASIEDAITDVLVEKTVTATQIYNIDQIMVAGGVAANRILAKKIHQKFSERRTRGIVHIPPPFLCTDNAVYVAANALYLTSSKTIFAYNYKPVDPLSIQANPSLTFFRK